jgi:hypothetical protein
MATTGNLRKLAPELTDPVSYSLPVGDEQIKLNEIIGSNLQLNYLGEINCIHCGRKTSKSFQQGYCYPCFQTLAECDSCLIKPELCHYHEGTCREPKWGEEHCFQDHFVYLANTSGLKVGITRQTNVPTRWMDQGATQALPIYKVRDRLVSGQVEVLLKNHVADKTAWQRMLKNDSEPMNLIEQRDKLNEVCSQELMALMEQLGDDAITFLFDEKVIEFNYPVLEYPTKVKSLNLDKTPDIKGKLLGIKGQYLILDSGVLNIRKFSGYKVTFSA